MICVKCVKCIAEVSATEVTRLAHSQNYQIMASSSYVATGRSMNGTGTRNYGRMNFGELKEFRLSLRTPKPPESDWCWLEGGYFINREKFEYHILGFD